MNEMLVFNEIDRLLYFTPVLDQFVFPNSRKQNSYKVEWLKIQLILLQQLRDEYSVYNTSL